MSTPSTNSDQKTICISEAENGPRLMPSLPTSEEEEMCTINYLLVGDSSAEKTNLIHAYLEQFFPGQHHIPCLFFEHTLNITIKGTTIVLKIWDLTGQECYDKLRQLAYKQIGFDVILICFSIVDPDSLESVKQIWAPEIKWNCHNRPFFLVGTQFDLRTDKSTFERLEMEGKLPVTRSKGNRVAKSLKAQKYFECSVSRKQGIKECFNEAIAAGLKNRQKRMRKNGEMKSSRNESNCSIQ